MPVIQLTKNQYNSPSTDLNFFGKSGTLTGIRSLSGYLYIPDGIRMVSLIHSSMEYNPHNFVTILDSIYKNSDCTM